MRALCLLALLLPCTAQAEAVVVTHMLKSGSVIAEADVTLVDAEIPGAITSLDAALGQAVSETIYPGRPVLQDKKRILAVMKDGEFHRAPPMRGAGMARAGSAPAMTRWAA